MAMLIDLLKQFMSQEKGSHKYNDPGIELPLSYLKKGPDSEHDNINMTPKDLMGNKKLPDSITTDDGNFSTDQNPFNIQKYLNGGEKGTMREFYRRMTDSNTPLNKDDGMGPDPLSGGTVTKGADLSPVPSAQQPQPDLASTNVPLPQPRPAQAPDYSQPSALDPQSIEELRTSLMTQAGQMDPNNPNGLSGRMNSPMAGPDMGQQGSAAMNIEDSVRGFDGSPKPHDMSSVTSGAGPGDESVSSALPNLAAMLGL